LYSVGCSESAICLAENFVNDVDSNCADESTVAKPSGPDTRLKFLEFMNNLLKLRLNNETIAYEDGNEERLLTALNNSKVLDQMPPLTVPDLSSPKITTKSSGTASHNKFFLKRVLSIVKPVVKDVKRC